MTNFTSINKDTRTQSTDYYTAHYEISDYFANWRSIFCTGAVLICGIDRMPSPPFRRSSQLQTAPDAQLHQHLGSKVRAARATSFRSEPRHTTRSSPYLLFQCTEQHPADRRTLTWYTRTDKGLTARTSLLSENTRSHTCIRPWPYCSHEFYRFCRSTATSCGPNPALSLQRITARKSHPELKKKQFSALRS